MSITESYSDDSCYVFIINFNNESKQIELPFEYEVLSGTLAENIITPYGCVILKK